MDQPQDSSRGLLLGIGAFVWWGLSPLFWKLLGDTPPSFLLAHRVTWAVPVFVLGAVVVGQGPAILPTVKDGRQLRWMALSSVFVSLNWLVYLIAVVTDRVLHASLGYFLNPLISTLLGALVLGERLHPAQWVAVILAFLGVLWLGIALGEIPWIGLVLASSFGVYGLLRKQAPVPPLAGSAVEVLLISPLALAGVGWLTYNEGLPDLVTSGLLLATGVVTAVPLLLFAASVKEIRLSTMGILQYLAPSLQFLLAVLAFGEPFRVDVHLPAFVLIWAGIALFVARYRAVH